MTPKITIEVTKAEDAEVDMADVARHQWGARIEEVPYGTEGSQVVWEYDDLSGGVAVKGDALTDEQLDFLADCADGAVPAWRVDVTIEHPSTGTLLADDSVVRWGPEPDPADTNLANRAFGKYTSMAADAMAWFDKVRQKTPAQPDLVELYVEFGQRLKG